MSQSLRFGLFTIPQHRPGQSQSLLLQKELELIAWAERCGFDEVWIGEHNFMGGWDLVSEPEVFIAAAAERTKRIKLGTTVIGLPYRHPYVIANRAVLLDNLTRGRFVLGVCPGGTRARRPHDGHRGGEAAPHVRRGAGGRHGPAPRRRTCQPGDRLVQAR
jgi:limonene 1,2-monooxygenase